MLLLVEGDPIPEEQGCKKDAFRVYGTGYIEMIIALLAEIVALYIWGPIVKVKVTGLEKAIASCKVCFKLARFLALNKQF